MSKFDTLTELCRSLEGIEKKAEALGLFLNDRELLECPCCGLFEDVTIQGILLTARKVTAPPIYTGLRFQEVSQNTYQCPDCAQQIELQAPPSNPD